MCGPAMAVVTPCAHDRDTRYADARSGIARAASRDGPATAVGAGGAPTVACAVASTAIARRCDAPLT
ncbi:hypothetical protein XFF6992_170206 [Xanthomonas citri pv. fuscans]|uniref:Uncharacterized protein n=1 Tax=Xanthomonas campestris pv. phaseoli TaxID=317013 RepID=A0A7Z7J0A5_XANCH|nr:hypothetical protein XFF6990_140067 [Xanthomonas citri pv. fuscans]SOO17613.1 hypothetical protein XFF6992_170206 [Xanthomonas citri pv. fuscans]SOO23614.1 hypothetical protein XFF6991_290021 [Xanthomonas phaseoli pv. phaseoli]